MTYIEQHKEDALSAGQSAKRLKDSLKYGIEDFISHYDYFDAALENSFSQLTTGNICSFVSKIPNLNATMAGITMPLTTCTTINKGWGKEVFSNKTHIKI